MHARRFTRQCADIALRPKKQGKGNPPKAQVTDGGGLARRYISCQYWSYSLMAKIEFRGRTLVDCGLSDADPSNDQLDESQCVEVEDVAVALFLPRNLDETVMVEVAVLFLQIVLVRYVTYLVLRRRTRS